MIKESAGGRLLWRLGGLAGAGRPDGFRSIFETRWYKYSGILCTARYLMFSMHSRAYLMSMKSKLRTG